MYTTRQYLGTNFPGMTQIPLRPGNSQARLYLAPVVLIGAVVVAILLATQSNNLGYQLQLAGLGLALGVLGAAVLLWEVSVSAGVVRFEDPSGSLRFHYPPGLGLLYPLAAACMMFPAAVALLRGEGSAQIGFGRRTAYTLGILGLIFFLQQLWALRVPRGLALSEAGLRGVRGAEHLVLAWADLDSAAAMSARSGAKLALHTTRGEVHVLPRHVIGSDPNAVAAIINYYLQYPQDRGYLTDPEGAIRRVAQSR